MPFRVVCISSDDGAGAAETARLVAEALGFRLINEEIVAHAAIETGVDRDVVADVERRKSLVARLLDAIGPAGMAAGQLVMIPEDLGYDQPRGNELRGAIQSVIEEMATAGKVVIVAHAASLALAARDDVLRVRVTASLSTRQRAVAASLAVDEKEATKLLTRSDAGRADYIKRFYGIAVEQPTHYDLVINTDRLAADDAGRLIVDAVNRRS